MTAVILTKTARRRINSRIRALHRERRDTLAGRYLPWGVPLCRGPASSYCQGPDYCEGCCTRLMLGDEADRISGQIGELQAQLVPAGQPAQGGLW